MSKKHMEMRCVLRALCAGLPQAEPAQQSAGALPASPGPSEEGKEQQAPVHVSMPKKHLALPFVLPPMIPSQEPRMSCPLRTFRPTSWACCIVEGDTEKVLAPGINISMQGKPDPEIF
eukprot:1157465-Pelagomonas_calceolata.AAC.5